jgi:glutamyl-tRNA reductase
VLAAGGLDAAEATRLLINRLLHDPSEALRRLAAESDDPAAAEALLRRLFAMNDDAAPAAEPADDEEKNA